MSTDTRDQDGGGGGERKKQKTKPPNSHCADRKGFGSVAPAPPQRARGRGFLGWAPRGLILTWVAGQGPPSGGDATENARICAGVLGLAVQGMAEGSRTGGGGPQNFAVKATRPIRCTRSAPGCACRVVGCEAAGRVWSWVCAGFNPRAMPPRLPCLLSHGRGHATPKPFTPRSPWAQRWQAVPDGSISPGVHGVAQNLYQGDPVPRRPHPKGTSSLFPRVPARRGRPRARRGGRR